MAVPLNDVELVLAVVPLPPPQAVNTAIKVMEVSCKRNINYLFTTKVYLRLILLQWPLRKASGFERYSANRAQKTDAIQTKVFTRCETLRTIEWPLSNPQKLTPEKP
jgi:hypothetical protein